MNNNHWNQSTISNITERVSVGHVGPTSMFFCSKEKGIPLIRSQNVRPGKLDLDGVVHITKESHRRLKKSQVTAGDVLIVRVGHNRGDCCIVPEGLGEMNCANVILIKPGVVHPKYLESYLRSHYGQHQLLGLSTGSAQAVINTKAIASASIPVPSTSEQIRIGSSILMLDDKIHLLRQQNATLEAMAQALFKSWFVDFDPVIDNALAAGRELPEALAVRVAKRRAVLDSGEYPALPAEVRRLFPDGFVFSEALGRWVPEGWEVKQINEICKINPESWTAKRHPETVEYVDLSSVNKGTIDTTTFYSFQEAPSRARRILCRHDTIIGLVRPGNKAYTYIEKDNLTGSTGFAVVRSIGSNARTFVYLLLTQESTTEYFAHVADGGAYPAIKPSVIGEFLATFPGPTVLDSFQEATKDFFEMTSTNNSQIATLTRLRDVLLPELISGRVKV